MTEPSDFSGLVLAGGYSTRFGDEDKAVAELAGTPMIRRVVDRLGTVVDDIVINCRDDQQQAIRDAVSGASPDIRFAIDDIPDRGPLGGIHNGLQAVAHEYSAVVACDMPFVEPALLTYLHDRARGVDGAVVQLDDQWYQTTQAVYRSMPMAAACGDALDMDDGRILTALANLDWVVVDDDELENAGISRETFTGIDTKADLEEAASRV